MRTNPHIRTSDKANYSLKSVNPSINLQAFLHWVKIGFWNDGTGLLW